MLGGENLFPQPDISDSFFDFIEMKGKQLNFIDQFTATIVVNSDNCTYWKIERYVDNKLDKTMYFYTERQLGIIRNGFIYELTLDMYMTYTRTVLLDIKNKKLNPIVQRGSLLNEHFKNDNFINQPQVFKALKEPEQNVLGGNDSYSGAEQFHLLAEGTKGNYSDSFFPFKVTDLVYYGTKSLPDMFSWFYKASDNNKFQSSTRYGLWGSKLYKNNVLQTDYSFAVNWTRDGNRWVLDRIVNEDKKNKFFDLLKQSYSIESVEKVDNDNWDEINRNMLNGYFAVFVHPDGYIDAYPLIGKFTARINTPYYNIENVKQVTQLNGTLDVVWNLDERASVKTLFHNDYPSIQKDLINLENNPEGYTVKSYLGIYRWIYPLGDKAQVMFSFSGDGKSHEVVTENINGGTKKVGTFAVLKRFFYRFNYNDAIGFNLINGKNLVNPDKFMLFDGSSSTSFTRQYIDLLQPIVLGGNEIIPAKYSFLAKKNNNQWTFSIPMTTAFTSGFKLYCKTFLYNNPTLITDLGGTLPTANGEYFQTLRQIELQKNAGVASAMGNLFARPINWLSGGFNLGNTFGVASGNYNSTAENSQWKNRAKRVGRFNKYPDKITKSNTIGNSINSVGNESYESSFGATVGGLGGFISDAINIDKAIKQAEVAKKNIGIGYMSTTDTDMYNAINHNAFILDITKNEDNYPLKKGIFSTAYRKLFDQATIDKYLFYYDYWGFPFDDYLGGEYINILLNSTTNNPRFVSFDRNWCLTKLNILSTFNDNDIRGGIIDQLVSGLRIGRY